MQVEKWQVKEKSLHMFWRGVQVGRSPTCEEKSFHKSGSPSTEYPPMYTSFIPPQIEDKWLKEPHRPLQCEEVGEKPRTG